MIERNVNRINLITRILVVVFAFVSIKYYFELKVLHLKIDFLERKLFEYHNESINQNPNVNGPSLTQFDTKLNQLTENIYNLYVQKSKEAESFDFDLINHKLDNLVEDLNIFLETNNNKEIEQLTKTIVKAIEYDPRIQYEEPSNVTQEPNVIIFDLNKPLLPENVYDSIDCKKSATYVVNTTLCIYDIEKDVFISKSISLYGVYEPAVLEPLTNYLKENPDWLLIDLGAHIGQFSLFAAKMGHHVLCVEPFIENVYRIHKAARIENIQDKIILINNAISNKRNEIKMLKGFENNVGSQSLLENKDKSFKRGENPLTEKYLAETILLDDIVKYIPRRENKKRYRKAIMKMDIETFEVYAFEYGRRLFNKLDIQVIYMEWGLMVEQYHLHDLIQKMINFLNSKKYLPYDQNGLLNLENWRKWPWDVVWKKI